jgi:ferredoxin
MATVRYPRDGLEAEVPLGSTILQASSKCGAKEGHACGGVCACSTCHVYVLAGLDLLSEMQDDENDILDKAFDVRSNSRLGCQASVEREGVIEVEISRESRKAWEDEH